MMINKIGAYNTINSCNSSEMSSKNKISFGANGFPENPSIASGISDSLNAVDMDYLEKGSKDLEILLDGKNTEVIAEASNELVRGGHFERIKDYFSTLNGSLSKKDALIVFDISHELSKLSKNNQAVGRLVQTIRQNAPDDAKTIINSCFKTLA